jgi:hypothetical protein
MIKNVKGVVRNVMFSAGSTLDELRQSGVGPQSTRLIATDEVSAFISSQGKNNVPVSLKALVGDVMSDQCILFTLKQGEEEF